MNRVVYIVMYDYGYERLRQIQENIGVYSTPEKAFEAVGRSEFPSAAKVIQVYLDKMPETKYEKQ